MHGLGWGNVKTGFVSKKKLGFLQREMSVDRDSNTSSPVPNGKSRGLRVTFADSPSSSRPASNLGWSDVRAQTPPLAGEWSTATATSSTSSTSQLATATNGSFLAQKSPTTSVQGKSFMSQQKQQQQSSSSFQSSQSSTFSSSVQKSSFSSSHSQSSSIQASKAFEAFPGLGVIENLKIE